MIGRLRRLVPPRAYWPHVLLVLVPVLFNAFLLWPELATPLPSVNDDANHYLFVVRASEALARGENPFDHWVPQMEIGFPEFFYYQHLPHLAVVAVDRLTFGLFALLDLFNAVRFVLLVGLPITVFWAMRRMDFDRDAAAFGAAVSTLISANYLFGFEYESYVWRGFGMYTQLWAMHLSFVVLALVHRLMTRGSGQVVTAVAFSALALSHLAYAYMAVISAVALAALGATRATALRRLARLAFVGAVTVLVSAYMAVPFVLEREYLNVSPGLPAFRFDSFGAPQVLEWLARGELFDHGRLPVLTTLLGIGIVVSVVRRRHPMLAALALFLVWLILYFGRATLGPIADLLPFREGLPMHRFIGSLHLAAILLIGVAGAWLWRLPARLPRVPRQAAAIPFIALALLPAFGERAAFLGLNRTWMEQTKPALDRDRNAELILERLMSLPPGRVYTGLRATWGEKILDLGLSFTSLRFRDLITFEGLWGATPPYYSWSMNADLVFDFDDTKPAHYDVFNARYVVAPTGLAPQPFWQVELQAGPYTLYHVATSGYAEFVGIVERRGMRSQAELYTQNRHWLAGPLAAADQAIRWDYPAPLSNAPIGAPPCSGGSVEERAIEPDRLAFRVRCASSATLSIKTTYHPNWRVTVDGVERETFMLSPSYIGVAVPAGEHDVVAHYQAHTLKTPLLVLAVAVLVVLAVFRRRLASAI